MDIILNDDTTTIQFRGRSFIVPKTDLTTMQMMRQERIDSGRYFIPNGEDVVDHFAPNGIQLEDGGEVCPIEMSHHVGPTSSGNRLMIELFGQQWHLYDGWSPAT